MSYRKVFLKSHLVNAMKNKNCYTHSITNLHNTPMKNNISAPKMKPSEVSCPKLPCK